MNKSRIHVLLAIHHFARRLVTRRRVWALDKGVIRTMIELSDLRVKASVTLEALYLLMISCEIL